MGFQNTVNDNQAFGVIGELYDTSIRRVTPFKLAAASKIGTPAWLQASTGKATGTYDSSTAAKLLGIFVNPKEYTNHNGNVQTATLEMTTDSVAQVADVGHVNVLVSAETTVGQDIYVLVAKGSAVTVELGAMKGADSDPSTGSSTTLQTWKKVGKCVRVGATAAGQVAVMQIIV